MRISHVALYTADLEALAGFYERYFGGKAGGVYRNPARGFASRFVEFDCGPSLEIMTLESGLGNMPEGPRAGYSHMAFSVGGRAEVDALTERLRRDGYAVTGKNHMRLRRKKSKKLCFS